MDRYAQPVLYVPEAKARKADRQTTTQRLLDKVHPYGTSIPDLDKSKVDESLKRIVSQNHVPEFDQIPVVNSVLAAPRPPRETPMQEEMCSSSQVEKRLDQKVARRITDADRDFHAFVEQELRMDQQRRLRRHGQGSLMESDLRGPHTLAPGRRVRQGSVHTIESATDDETFVVPPKVARADRRTGAEANIDRGNRARKQRPSKHDLGRFMKRSSTVDSNATLKAFPQVYRTSAYRSRRSMSSAERKENDTDEVDSDGSDVLVRSPNCMDLATLGGCEETITEIEANRRRRGSVLSRRRKQDTKPSGMDIANHGWEVVAVEKQRDEVEQETDSAGSSASVVSVTPRGD
jgi:hypothetical protein